MTLLFNLGRIVTLSVLANLNQVRGFQMGYLLPISIGLLTGLIFGSNSFLSSDVNHTGRAKGWPWQFNWGTGDAGLSSHHRRRDAVGRLPIQELVAVEWRMNTGQADETTRYPSGRE